MTGWESPSHWLVIALVVLVLFGYKKLPEMSRSVGRSLRIFKTEMKGMGKDDEVRESAETAGQQAGSTAAVTGQPAVVESPVPPVTPPPVIPATPAQELPPAAVEEPRPAPQQRT